MARMGRSGGDDMNEMGVVERCGHQKIKSRMLDEVGVIVIDRSFVGSFVGCVG